MVSKVPMRTKNFHQKSPSPKTSKQEEGKVLGELSKLWQDIASSEARLKLMSDLKDKKLGFGEIETFSLGLEYNLKSEKLKDSKIRPTNKIVEEAMKLKMRDEAIHHQEMLRKREKMKTWLKKLYSHKIYQYKKTIKELRTGAGRVKKEQEEKYLKKMEHLERKFKKEEEDLKPPPGMEELGSLSIFRNEEFDNIKISEIEVPKIGEILLSKEEEQILRRTPKYALPEQLREHTLKEEMEKAYCKMRMELRDEESNRPT